MVAHTEREALGFLQDPENPCGGDREARWKAVRGEIRATGTYRHTSEELVHGCRIAWRNHARCVGRLHWKALHIVDHHTVTRQFVTHEERERRRGRTTPADRDWIVPPLSASTTPVFRRAYVNAAPRPNFRRQPTPLP